MREELWKGKGKLVYTRVCNGGEEREMGGAKEGSYATCTGKGRRQDEWVSEREELKDGHEKRVCNMCL